MSGGPAAVGDESARDRDAQAFGLEGLRHAYERHEAAQHQRDLRGAYISGVEGVWWVCALDEELGGNMKQANDYKSARDADPNGLVVLGLRWLRNRHTHELPLTAAFDDTAFFGSGRGIIALSKGFYWRPSDDIDPQRIHMIRRHAYDVHVAGNSSGKTLVVALRWLEQAQEHRTSR